MTPLRLALADLWHERVIFLCNVALVAGVVAPILILLGVKTGIMDTLFAELRDDPEKRRIAIVGDHVFTPEDVAEVAAWPLVGFAAPASRSIAQRIYVKAEGGNRIRRAALFPTGPKDPLLPEALQLEDGEVAVSAGLARRLGLAAGSKLEASIPRGDPPDEYLSLALAVVHVLPPGALDGDAMLMQPARIDLVEAFLDDFALPDYGVTAGHPLLDRVVSYESIRLYAVDISGVAALVARLEDRFQLVTKSATAEIETIAALDGNLNRALFVVAAAAVAGLFWALMAALWANVQRKRRVLSILRLTGCESEQLLLFPALQAVIVAAAGCLLALALYGAGAAAINQLFAGSISAQERVCSLSATAAGAVFAGVVLLAALAASAASLSASRIDPAVALREG